MTSAPRTGRRSGKADTRERILGEARDLFSSKGFERTSLRSIAAAAGVDVALIGHYFGNKKGLILEAMSLPIDPQALIATLADLPDEQLAEGLLRGILTAWESPAGPGTVAAFRSAMSGEDDPLLKDFMLGVVFAPLRERIDTTYGDGVVRIQLATSQIAGLLIARKVLALQPLAGMPVEDVVALVAPAIQRYLTGELLP